MIPSESEFIFIAAVSQRDCGKPVGLALKLHANQILERHLRAVAQSFPAEEFRKLRAELDSDFLRSCGISTEGSATR